MKSLNPIIQNVAIDNMYCTLKLRIQGIASLCIFLNNILFLFTVQIFIYLFPVDILLIVWNNTLKYY